ncbi:DNA alkylation repair protein [Angustibacter sp. Root456]|uniref:DNA alkylation repair protein n=1 Tax=Angustibacter sp. Root456 TaxID=1736539 RepID=UPI000701399D|nr:DNA alkylation repair protein [Angustibacter sp. Root456]KQX66496.1 DNA alkylation repair protein [Angustibacter sp. Root456]
MGDDELELVQAIREQLRDLAEPSRAPAMQAYMKSAMPFLGVRVPVVRSAVHAVAREHPPADFDELVAAATVLWREAAVREERYAATALTGLPLALGRLELLPLHEEMIVTGAWWDHCDEVAHRVGRTLQAHPEQVAPLLRAWARDRDRWLRRCAIIGQLGLRERTDVALLTDVVDANLGDHEFFVRKAIGWALRDYGHTDPRWVRAFVTARHDALSPLSRREALKHLA